MNSIEVDRARATAAALFDEGIVPLAEARRAAGQQAYFPLGRDASAASYFQQPALTMMRPADFELPGGGTAEGLADALAEMWNTQGEVELAALAPGLKEIAKMLRAEAASGDGSISILCYTMF